MEWLAGRAAKRFHGETVRIARQLTAVVRKDLLLEWRGRSRLLSVVLFGVVTLLLFSFAIGPDSVMLRAAGGGFLVLALLLSSIALQFVGALVIVPKTPALWALIAATLAGGLALFGGMTAWGRRRAALVAREREA